jgi:hypothetical protein
MGQGLYLAPSALTFTQYPYGNEREAAGMDIEKRRDSWKNLTSSFIYYRHLKLRRIRTVLLFAF